MEFGAFDYSGEEIGARSVLGLHEYAKGRMTCAGSKVHNTNIIDAKPRGLEYYPNYISDQQQLELQQLFDSLVWHGNGQPPNSQLKRKTLQFGHLFDYNLRKITATLPIPPLLQLLISRLNLEFGENFNHICINNYELGQGIMPHIDAPLFGPKIVVISMLSSCLMEFSKDLVKYQLKLEPKSLILMQDVARYDYKHSISKDLVEYLDGEEIVRERRISITFRSIL